MVLCGCRGCGGDARPTPPQGHRHKRERTGFWGRGRRKEGICTMGHGQSTPTRHDVGEYADQPCVHPIPPHLYPRPFAGFECFPRRKGGGQEGGYLKLVVSLVGAIPVRRSQATSGSSISNMTMPSFFSFGPIPLGPCPCPCPCFALHSSLHDDRCRQPCRLSLVQRRFPSPSPSPDALTWPSPSTHPCLH